MNKQELLSSLEKNSVALLDAIAAFTDEQFNTVPFPGSWTGGQVTEHLWKSESGIPELVFAETTATTRDPGEKAPGLENMFLDFSIKMNSPPFILPSAGPHDKEHLFISFEQNRQAIKSIIEKEDLTRTCSFPFPGEGQLTRQEWIRFALAHATRHTRQLNNIREKLIADQH